MRKLFSLLVLAACFTVVGCNKNTNCQFADYSKAAPEIEKNNLLDSLQKYGITATEHPLGFYYKIVDQGTGDYVKNLCSSVSVKYKGQYFDGRGFDSALTNPVTFVLGQLIPAWQKAIPLVNEGGKIFIYVPPTLGYGSTGAGAIPPNAYLTFEVEVVKIK